MRIAAKERQYRNPVRYPKADNQRVQPKVRYPRMKNRSVAVRDTAPAPRKRNYQTYRGNPPRRRQTWRRVCRYALALLLAVLALYLYWNGSASTRHAAETTSPDTTTPVSQP